MERYIVKGMFITFEGPDGAGKTSIIEGIKKKLQEVGEHSVVFTREPGGSPIAEEIRNVTLNPAHTEMDARTEALLIAAGRRQHIVEKILPALNAGNTVICDRFVDSSLVYQGHARGIGVEEVRKINEFSTDSLQPDATLYLDVTAEVGLDRIEKAKKNRQYDRLDQEKVEFHHKVREGYHLLLEKDSGRIIEIDASQSEEEVLAECWKHIQQLLNINEEVQK